MYLKHIHTIQCLLFTMILINNSRAVANIAKELEEFFLFAPATLPFYQKMRELWFCEITPKDSQYCRCSFDFCDCCEVFERKKICIYLDSPEPEAKGVRINTVIDGERQPSMIVSSRNALAHRLGFTPKIRNADFIYKLYDFGLKPFDELTVSVKLCIRIEKMVVFVCDMGTFTLTVPHACELFFVETSHPKTTPRVPGVGGPWQGKVTDSWHGKVTDSWQGKVTDSWHGKVTDSWHGKVTDPSSDGKEDKCLVVDCGLNNLQKDFEGRILDGEDARLGELPWMVHFEYHDKIKFDCSGVLVDCQWVLTSVHCVWYVELNRFLNFRLKMGKVRLKEQEPKQKTRSFTHIIYHPQSNLTHDFNNLALVKLNKPVEFNDHIQPICIPTAHMNFERHRCIISGWGETETKIVSDVLMLARIIVHTKEECKKSGPIILDSHICAGTESKRPHLGDHGSPLQCSMNGQYYVAGVYSADFKQDRHRFRFQKVSSYIDWIHQTMGLF